ncbi:hypothetical protein [Kordia sp.]|uniref:hypothetical protein n=1 Tax=Kordia sp. TaxID=1965332 RepID=UPI003D6C4D72
MFKDYLLLINDYLMTLGKGVWFDIITPLFIAVISFFLFKYDIIYLSKDFIGNVLSVLGILAGFSITSVTILTSSENDKINELKSYMTGKVVDGLEISRFRKIYIMISYSVLVTLFVIILNIVAYLFPWSKLGVNLNFLYTLKTLELFLLIHIFLLNIKNITYLYFIFFNDTNRKGSTQKPPL